MSHSVSSPHPNALLEERVDKLCTALEIIRSEIEPQFETLAGPADREALCQSILRYLAHSEAPATGLTKDDPYGALACFWLVFLSCLPVADYERAHEHDFFVCRAPPVGPEGREHANRSVARPCP